MQCPCCPGVVLALSVREGIEIDYCPSCRGVWLDRGELDKLVERAELRASVPVPARAGAGGARDDRDLHDRDHGYRKPPHKKRKSFLSELFELGD